MKRKWIKIMIGLIILTGFALVPKERTSQVAGEPKNFLGAYGLNDTIRIQIIGYDENLDTDSSKLRRIGKTTPDFSNKSISSAKKGDGTIVYLLTLQGAKRTGQVEVFIEEGMLVDADGNKNGPITINTDAFVVSGSPTGGICLIGDGKLCSYNVDGMPWPPAGFSSGVLGRFRYN